MLKCDWYKLFVWSNALRVASNCWTLSFLLVEGITFIVEAAVCGRQLITLCSLRQRDWATRTAVAD